MHGGTSPVIPAPQIRAEKAASASLRAAIPSFTVIAQTNNVTFVLIRITSTLSSRTSSRCRLVLLVDCEFLDESTFEDKAILSASYFTGRHGNKAFLAWNTRKNNWLALSPGKDFDSGQLKRGRSQSMLTADAG
jgi:hypothetical protein